MLTNLIFTATVADIKLLSPEIINLFQFANYFEVF
jgi:hypothetical protein